ncbi:MAG: PH domain-containing protein [Tepidisphaeraceae bacterium]
MFGLTKKRCIQCRRKINKSDPPRSVGGERLCARCFAASSIAQQLSSNGTEIVIYATTAGRAQVEVTSRRIRLRRKGFLGSDSAEMPLAKVEEISVRTGLFSSSLTINGSGGSRFRLSRLPDPQKLRDVIMTAAGR